MLFFLMQTLCILLLGQQLAYVFPLTHRFPLKSAIKCWSSWQPSWNIIIFNSIHRCLHWRDLKEKGFPVIFHGGIVLSTWLVCDHSSGCFMLPFPDRSSSSDAIKTQFWSHVDSFLLKEQGGFLYYLAQTQTRQFSQKPQNEVDQLDCEYIMSFALIWHLAVA